MPRYDYWCAHCQTSYEKQLKIAEATIEQTCPECGEATRKMLTTFSVHAAAASFAPESSCAMEGGCCGGGSCNLN